MHVVGTMLGARWHAVGLREAFLVWFLGGRDRHRIDLESAPSFQWRRQKIYTSVNLCIYMHGVR